MCFLSRWWEIQELQVTGKLWPNMFALRLNVAGGFRYWKWQGRTWFKTWYSKFIPVYKDDKSWGFEFQCHCGMSHNCFFPWTSSCASCWLLHIHSKCRNIAGIVTSNLQVDQAGWDIPVHVKLNACGRIIHGTWIAPCECNPFYSAILNLPWNISYHYRIWGLFLKDLLSAEVEGISSMCKTLGARAHSVSEYE